MNVPPTTPPGDPEDRAGPRLAARDRMVRDQLWTRGIRDERVLAAMARVPRHEFVPPSMTSEAYRDSPLAIGDGQTISQPYIVALMTEMLEPRAGDRILDVGTGSGYQAAVLAELSLEVYSVEIIAALHRESRRRLSRMGYTNVLTRRGDGAAGWPEHAPFEAILIAACGPAAPAALIEQLRPGGRMVLPLGDPAGEQRLVRLTRRAGLDVDIEDGVPVRFVPMTGEDR